MLAASAWIHFCSLVPPGSCNTTMVACTSIPKLTPRKLLVTFWSDAETLKLFRGLSTVVCTHIHGLYEATIQIRKNLSCPRFLFWHDSKFKHDIQCPLVLKSNKLQPIGAKHLKPTQEKIPCKNQMTEGDCRKLFELRNRNFET